MTTPSQGARKAAPDLDAILGAHLSARAALRDVPADQLKAKIFAVLAQPEVRAAFDSLIPLADALPASDPVRAHVAVMIQGSTNLETLRQQAAKAG